MVGVAYGRLELSDGSEIGPPVLHGQCCLQLLFILLDPDTPL